MSDFFTQLKHGRLFGHPIHSMLVHFPSALFPISLVFDIAAIGLKSSCFACASFYSIAAGILLGFLAAIVGSVDYVRLSASDSAWKKASSHALLSVIWLLIFSIILGLRLKPYPNIPIATPIEMILSTIAVIGLIFSNFLGADLIFRHRLGLRDEKI